MTEQTQAEFLESDTWARFVEDAARAEDYFTLEELEEYAEVYNRPADNKFGGARLLLEVPQNVKHVDDERCAMPVIEFELVLVSHARVTDLNRYAVNPGDGKTYRIFEAEEMYDVLHSQRSGTRTHTRYKARGVQVYP